MELVRLRPLLPGQQSGDHCVRVGLTKSTSFPRAVKKGKEGEQKEVEEERGWMVGRNKGGYERKIAAIRSACKKKKEGRGVRGGGLGTP